MSAYRAGHLGAVLCWSLTGLCAIAMGDAPTTAPTTAAAPVVSPDARKALDELDAAYGKLATLDLAGTMSQQIDAAGQARNDSANFTSSFLAPNFFRHEVQGNLVCGSTGTQAYSFLPQRSIYTSADAPGSRVAIADMPKPLGDLLDPSLKLASSKTPSADLLADASAVSIAPDTTVDGTAFHTLVVDSKDMSLTLLVDSQTHLIRRATTDASQLLRSQGIPDVKSAKLIVDYTRSAAGTKLTPEQFAWKAPAGARDVTATAAAPGPEGDEPAEKLVGLPAPDFKLTGLDQKPVKLADLKGSVAILDFWATWCGPCRASLPHLDAVYNQFKSNGLKVYAVNCKEEPDTIQKFIDETKLSVPVLLDGDGAAATSYRASGIPETVLIGKDGKVRNVFIGFSPDGEGQLRDAVAAALAQ